MDMIASIDDQIERLKEMRAHLVAEQKKAFDAAQIPLPIADAGAQSKHVPIPGIAEYMMRQYEEMKTTIPAPIADDGWTPNDKLFIPEFVNGTIGEIKKRNGNVHTVTLSHLLRSMWVIHDAPDDIIAYRIAVELT